MPQPTSFPFACFVGLAVGPVEVTIPGYARRPVVLAVTADGVTVSNTGTVQWPPATASWGVIDTVTFWDDTGVLLVTLPAVVPLEIRQYDAARIPASSVPLGLTSDGGRPFGSRLFGSHTYGGRHALVPIGLGVPGPFGVGPYGVAGYAATGVQGVPLERVFELVHVCAPGTWAPGPCAMAA